MLVCSAFFISNPSYDYLFLVLPFAIFMTALGAFYFKITVDELIIKNYMMPFFNIRYKLNEITQIQFLDAKATAKARVEIIRGNRQPLGIGFTAASLGIKDWQLFINELIAKKIPIKIEANSLKNITGIPEQ